MNIILFEAELFNGTELLLPYEDERADHIRRILKLSQGESFKAGLLNGAVGEARIEAFEEGGLRIAWSETGAPVGLYPLSLLVGYVRPISAKRILREAASLGVERIIFSATETGEKSYRQANLWKEEGRARRLLIDGLQQAGATMLPELLHCRSLDAAIERARAASKDDCAGASKGGSSGFDTEYLLLDTVVGKERLAALDLEERRVVLAIGSERGWSGRERERLFEAGYRGVRLGKRVLRTETACTSAAAVALARMGY